MLKSLRSNKPAHDANDATAYITFEPCCHQGRTPPCTQALIRAGIKTSIVATLDPNPLVAGKGIAELASCWHCSICRFRVQRKRNN